MQSSYTHQKRPYKACCLQWDKTNSMEIIGILRHAELQGEDYIVWRHEKGISTLKIGDWVIVGENGVVKTYDNDVFFEKYVSIGPSVKERAAKDFAAKYYSAANITHLEKLIELLRSIPHNDIMMQAAWTYELIFNPSNVTIEMIREKFGYDVAKLVLMANESDNVESISPMAKTIRLAEFICDADRSVRKNPQKARSDFKRQANNLRLLEKGDPRLFSYAMDYCI